MARAAVVCGHRWLCKERGIARATVTRCTEGYGGSGHIHTTRLLELSENLPMRVEIVDISERIDPLLPALEAMIGEGLLTIAGVHIRRYLNDRKSEPRSGNCARLF